MVDLWPGWWCLSEEGKRPSCSITEMLSSHWTLRPNPGHQCSGQSPMCRPLGCPAPSSKDTFHRAFQGSNSGPLRGPLSISRLYWESQATRPSHQDSLFEMRVLTMGGTVIMLSVGRWVAYK